MARTPSISGKLEKHVSDLENKVAELNQQLEQARQNLQNYNDHKQVIESILSLSQGSQVEKVKRKYTKRAKAE
jgi:phage shock protein A